PAEGDDVPQLQGCEVPGQGPLGHDADQELERLLLTWGREDATGATAVPEFPQICLATHELAGGEREGAVVDHPKPQTERARLRQRLSRHKLGAALAHLQLAKAPSGR